MCLEHKKTWYEGTGLNLHAAMKKAMSLPQSIRICGLTETVKRITGRFFQWLLKF